MVVAKLNSSNSETLSHLLHRDLLHKRGATALLFLLLEKQSCYDAAPLQHSTTVAASPSLPSRSDDDVKSMNSGQKVRILQYYSSQHRVTIEALLSPPFRGDCMRYDPSQPKVTALQHYPSK